MGCGKDIRYNLPPVPSTVAPKITTAPSPLSTDARRATTTAARRVGTLPGSPTTAARAVTTTVATVPWANVTANLVGLNSECGNLSFVSARPDRDSVIVGVAQQGLWASDNDAASWTKIGQGAGSSEITNRTSSLVYDPTTPDVYWESGLYNGNAVYKTTDGGATFRPLGSIVSSDQVSVDLSDPARKTLLAVQHERLELQRSADGGKTWANIAASVPRTAGLSLGTLVVDDKTYLLGTHTGSEAGIFRTTDSGATWTKVFAVGVAGAPVVSRSGGAIYWMLEGGVGLVKSVDKGVTWTTATPAGVFSPVATGVVELPDGRLAALSRTVIISADGGAKWRALGPGLPYLPNGLVYAPFRKAFYIWRFECGPGALPVADNAVMRIPFDYQAP